MADRLVTIRSFADEVNGSLAQQILEDSSIKSILSGRNASNIYSGLPAIADIELQVREKDAPKALEILASVNK